jgi:DNA-directed RNA polymerase subunit N (RpoN/RPB10)
MRKRTLLVMYLCLAGLFSLASAEDPVRCFICGKKIKGAYIEYDGKILCSQGCLGAVLPKCATCGKPVSAGQGLKGEYLRYNGKFYCSQACFDESLPKCGACGKPVNGGIKAADGKYYCCRECYQQSLPKCELCGKPLEAWTEIQGHIYCKECDDLPRCLNCDLPGAEVKLGDGRSLCNKCQPTAIMDQARAQELFDRVRADLKAQLGLSTDHAIAFHLVDGNELATVLGRRDFWERGFYRYHIKWLIRGKKKTVDSETYDVYILSGMSENNFKDVAGHELAHDINKERYPNVEDTKGRGKDVVEGFAEYVASLLNHFYGNDGINQAKLKNEKKEYSGGYQKFLDLTGRGGLPAALAYMEKLNRPGAKKAPSK